MQAGRAATDPIGDHEVVAAQMLKFVTAVLMAVTCATLVPVAPALGQTTGEDMLNPCRSLILPHPLGRTVSTEEALSSGRCQGTAETLAHVGKALPERQRNCAPVSRATETVAVFLALNRARLTEPFVDLAIEALRQKWPCSTQ